jgi:hypothetical protein
MKELSLKLDYPIEVSGESVSELVLKHRLTAADHLHMVKEAGFIAGPDGPVENEHEYELLRLAAATGQPPQALRQLDLLDYYKLRQLGNEHMLRRPPKT